MVVRSFFWRVSGYIHMFITGLPLRVVGGVILNGKWVINAESSGFLCKKSGTYYQQSNQGKNNLSSYLCSYPSQIYDLLMVICVVRLLRMLTPVLYMWSYFGDIVLLFFSILLLFCSNFDPISYYYITYSLSGYRISTSTCSGATMVRFM